MNIAVGIISALAIGYLLGSIANGVLIGKIFFHTDIRTQGSHNSGGTNTGRVLGKKYGLITILLDIAKTLLAMWLTLFIFRIPAVASYTETDASYLCYLAGASACIGHTFPVFFSFRGGKAVACLGAICLATNWMITLAGILVFLAVLLISKYVSLGSCIGSVCVAALSFVPFFTDRGMIFSQTGDLYYSLFLCFVAVFVIARHHSNIARIIRGTENKIHWFSREPK